MSQSLSQKSSGSQMEGLISQMVEKLSETIAMLESDEMSEQMRNDESLYEFKMDHIRKLVEENFNFGEEVTEIMNENKQLRATISLLQETVEKKDKQFNEAIDIIEISAKKHTKQKQEQILHLNSQIGKLKKQLEGENHSSDINLKKISQLTSFNQNNKTEKQHLKSQNHRLEEEINNLELQIRKLKKHHKEMQDNYERSFHLLKQQSQKEIQQYEGLAKKMQGDMLVIKTQWQKKCQETEKQLRQFYETQLLSLEEKKSKELLEHLETMKQGKQIVIKHDEEGINNRLECLKRQYEVKIQKLQQNNFEIQSLNSQLQSDYLNKCKQSECLVEKLRKRQQENEEVREEIRMEREKGKRENQKFQTVVSDFQRRMQQASIEKEERQVERTKLKDQIKFIEKKHQILNRNFNQQKQQNNNISYENEEVLNKNKLLEEEIKKIRKVIETSKQQIEKKNNNIQNLQKQLQSYHTKFQQVNKKYQLKKSQLKKSKGVIKKLIASCDHIQLQVNQLKKQLILVKDDIKYICEHQKKKSMSAFEKVADESELYKDKLDKYMKNKMNELINDIENEKQNQQAQFETLLHERDNLKREVKELEILFMQKEKEVEEAKRKVVSSEIEEVKAVFVEQIKREKLKVRRLEEDLINLGKDHQRHLDRAKMEVKEGVKVLTKKWMETLCRLEEQLRRKQLQGNKLGQKIHLMLSEYEELKNNQQSDRQEIKRYKKKYESLKEEKEEQVSDLLKRLERESKHKMHLEKQLRSIRTQFNKAESLGRGNTNKQFYEQRQQRAIATTDREKQMIQLRKLIAKTVKVVEEKPEKDLKSDWRKGFN